MIDVGQETRIAESCWWKTFGRLDLNEHEKSELCSKGILYIRTTTATGILAPDNKSHDFEMTFVTPEGKKRFPVRKLFDALHSKVCSGSFNILRMNAGNIILPRQRYHSGWPEWTERFSGWIMEKESIKMSWHQNVCWMKMWVYGFL